MEENKKCWFCKRTIVGKSKFGLCPSCINGAGTGGAIVGSLLGLIGLKVGADHIENAVKKNKDVADEEKSTN